LTFDRVIGKIEGQGRKHMHTITTTSGKRFDSEDHRALARLMFKRFGEDKEAFCAAWRRMLQNNAEDREILHLLKMSPARDQDEVRRTLMRHGNADARLIRVEYLDATSCRILNMLVPRVKQDGERAGQRNIGRAIARGMVRP
jgi:hypothetical protein